METNNRIPFIDGVFCFCFCRLSIFISFFVSALFCAPLFSLIHMKFYSLWIFFKKLPTNDLQGSLQWNFITNCLLFDACIERGGKSKQLVLNLEANENAWLRNRKSLGTYLHVNLIIKDKATDACDGERERGWGYYSENAKCASAYAFWANRNERVGDTNYIIFGMRDWESRTEFHQYSYIYHPTSNLNMCAPAIV